MTSSPAHGPRALRQLAALLFVATCCIAVPIGCGEPETQQSSMPMEFAAKLEKEHPELFIKKIGKKKVEKIEGRDKRQIIREEWRKAQEKASQ